MEINNRKQLVTQDNGNIEKIFPKNYMSNIVDEETGESLRIFLLKYNHIDLGYRSSKSSARLAVPIIMRRKGLYITYYLPDDVVITEFFNGNKTEVSDTNWVKDELWVKDVNELNVYDVKISDGSITLDKLSEEVMQLISSKGDITINNFPDNEDLELYTIYQDSNNKIDAIRFKDRDNSNGMAYKYLRKTKNMILSQSDFNQANTIYEIRYDFDLNGATINLPANSVLQFVGGSIKNGTLNGNNTVIEADSNAVIFDSVVIEGTWNVEHIYDSWFAFNTSPSYISNQIITNILALSNDDVYNTIHFEADRTYYFELPYKGRTNLGDDVRPNYWKLNTEEYAFLRIFTGVTSNTHLIFNNTLQMIPTNQGAYFIFHIESKENIQISGTGTINADALNHKYTDPFAGTLYYGEWGHIFNFRSCNNIVIKDVTLAYAFGDAIGLGNVGLNIDGNKGCLAATKNVTIDGVKVLYARRNGISLGGNNYSISNVYFEGCGSDAIKGTAPKAAIDFENDYTEIDPSGICTNVVMSNCKFKDNAYDVSSTIRWDLGEVPTGQLVTINGCNFTAPLRLNKSRGLTFNDCHIVGISSHDNSISPWTVSEEWIFNNCNFDELNPYLVVSANDYKHQFNNCTYPEDIQCHKIFRGSLAGTRAIKFSIPKPISVGELEFVAICTNSSYSIAHLPINTTKYTIGNNANLVDIRDIKIEARVDSYPRFSMYQQTPVFSYIDYNEDADNINIYFSLGGNITGSPLAGNTEVNIFMNSKTKYIVKEKPVSEGSTAGIYGGKWSEVSAITKTLINISEVPSTVVFPSREMYPNSTMSDLNQITNLKSQRMGTQIYVTDTSYRQPAYWDSTGLTWRTADGNRTLERSVTTTEALNTLTAKLTESDRGYRVYTSVHSSYLTWDGIQWLNEDGSLYSDVKFINKFFTIERLNNAMSNSNVTYKIVGNIDLDGGTLTIVTGSILDFQGGSFSNGTIVGNNTTIIANKTVFNNITLNGTWSNKEFNISLFNIMDNIIDNILVNLINIVKAGGTIRIPKGTWLCNTYVDLTISSPQKQFRILGDSGAILKNNTGSDYILHLVNFHDGTTQRKVRSVISGITFDCNNAGGLYLDNPNYIEVTNCSFIDYHTYGLLLSSSGESIISKCNFQGNSVEEGTGLRLTYNSGDSVISELSIYRGLKGIVLNNTGGCRICNNIIYGSVTCIELTSTDRLPAGNEIYSNELEPLGNSNNGAGIKITPNEALNYYSTNLSIHNNYFLIKEGAAIDIGKASSVTISENTIGVTSTAVTTSPIWMKLQRLVSANIVGNIITELRSTTTGISLTNCQYCTIKENRVLSIEANSTFIEINTGTVNCWYINNYNGIGNASGYLIKANIVVDTGGFIDNKANTALINYNLGTYCYLKEANINNLFSWQYPMIFKNSTTTNYIWFNSEQLYMKSGSAPTAYNDGTLITSAYGKSRGSTANRPALESYQSGFQYYDTTLNKYICWNGTSWVNLDGTALA